MTRKIIIKVGNGLRKVVVLSPGKVIREKEGFVETEGHNHSKALSTVSMKLWGGFSLKLQLQGKELFSHVWMLCCYLFPTSCRLRQDIT